MPVGQTIITDPDSISERLLELLTARGSLWRMASITKQESRFLIREQAKKELYHNSRVKFDRAGIMERLHATRLNLSVSEKTANKGHLLPDIIVPIANRTITIPNPSDQKNKVNELV